MRTRAGVLWERHGKWSVESIELDPPKAGEVLVHFVATGLCHSDEHGRNGDMPMIEIPCVGGHEGAGIVEEVGPGVVDLKPGDHVVATFVPSCGTCRWCSTGRQSLCDLGAHIMPGLMLDGTSRLHARGQDLRSTTMLGTFAERNVVSRQSLIKIDEDVPLNRACLLGCGVTTGWGSAVYGAQVQQGDTVVVVGCGGIGSSAIQGSRIAGAANVVAVDVVPGKKEIVEKLGATHFVTSVAEAHELVGRLTRGVGADSAMLTVGVAAGSMIGEFVAMVRKAGTAVITSAAPASDTTVTMSLLETALLGKTIRGVLFGNANARADIPRLVELYRSGQLLLDEMVTTTYKLDEVEQGFVDMLGGKNIRGVIEHSG